MGLGVNNLVGKDINALGAVPCVRRFLFPEPDQGANHAIEVLGDCEGVLVALTGKVPRGGQGEAVWLEVSKGICEFPGPGIPVVQPG